MHIFISYSHSTPFFAESIKSLLEEKGYSVWLDLADIHGGEAWKNKILRSLQNARIVVVIVTRQALSSQWVAREIEIAKELKRFIIPVLMERMDNDKALAKLKISDFQGIDFVNQRKQNAEKALLQAIKNYFSNSPDIAPLIRKLKTSNKSELLYTIQQLTSVKAPPQIIGSYLQPFLRDDDEEIRYETIYSLAEIGDSTAAGPLIALIQQEELNAQEDNFFTGMTDMIVTEAISALGEIGDTEALTFLHNRAMQKDSFAIAALGIARDHSSVQIISNVLNNLQHNELRNAFACIWALGRINAPEGAESINNWLLKGLRNVPLEVMEEQEINGIWHKDADYRWFQLRVPHYMAEDFVFDHRINVFKAALIVLGMLQNKQFLETIIKFLVYTKDYRCSNDIPSLNCAAALALGLLNDKRALVELRKLELEYRKYPAQETSNADQYCPLTFVLEAIRMLEE